MLCILFNSISILFILIGLFYLDYRYERKFERMQNDIDFLGFQYDVLSTYIDCFFEDEDGVD